MNYYISATTDKGLRKNVNQDSLMVKKLDSAQGEMVLAVLCDGMGGLQFGELASACMVSLFSNWVYDRLSEHSLRRIHPETIERDWKELINRANARIRGFGMNRGVRIGTTLTALLLTQHHFFLINIGDSRTYRLRAGGMIQMTRDHTLIAQEVEKGNMTQEQAERSNIRHLLTRCIGVEEQANADFYTGDLLPGDSFLLCSDGFYHKVSLQEIWNTTYNGRSFDSIEMRRKERLLIETDKQRGETDNISVITVHTHGNPSTWPTGNEASHPSDMEDDSITIMMLDDSDTFALSGIPAPVQSDPGFFSIAKDISLFAPADPRALAALTC